MLLKGFGEELVTEDDDDLVVGGGVGVGALGIPEAFLGLPDDGVEVEAGDDREDDGGTEEDDHAGGDPEVLVSRTPPAQLKGDDGDGEQGDARDHDNEVLPVKHIGVGDVPEDVNVKHGEEGEKRPHHHEINQDVAVKAGQRTRGGVQEVFQEGRGKGDHQRPKVYQKLALEGDQPAVTVDL